MTFVYLLSSKYPLNDLKMSNTWEQLLMTVAIHMGWWYSIQVLEGFNNGRTVYYKVCCKLGPFNVWFWDESIPVRFYALIGIYKINFFYVVVIIMQGKIQFFRRQTCFLFHNHK